MANKTVTVKSSGGDYTSLNAALAGESTNLVSTLDGILTIECYTINDTTQVDTGTGYTTDSSHYINITVPTAERHDGKWNTSKYRISLTSNADYYYGFTISENYTRVTGIQETLNAGSYSNNRAIFISASNVLIDSYIVKGAGTALIGIDFADACEYCSIRNSLAYDCPTKGFSLSSSNNNRTSALNCTAQNCGIGFTSPYNAGYVVNCLAASCTTGFTDEFYNSSCSNNASSNAYAPGTDSHTSHTFTFVDVDNDDFHLASSDTGAIDLGTSLSGTFTTDIDGETRSGTWDIGADEYVAAGASSIPLFDYYFNNMRP